MLGQNYSNILKFLPVIVAVTLVTVVIHSFVLILGVANGKIFDSYINTGSFWLYWFVIIFVFLFFFLVILNSSRLIQVEALNKEKNKVLQTLRTRLSALEVAQEGIFIADDRGLISYMNRSLYLINGLDLNDREKYIGREWLSIFSDVDRDIIEGGILAEYNSNGFWLGDLSIHGANNVITHVELSLTILPDGGLIGTIQDISEKHRAESEKKSLEAQFYQAQKMEAIGRLAGGIAHDFNNILAAMNGYAEFLKDDLPEGSDQYKFAENILQAGVQARELVDQMLAFSRTSESECKFLDLVVPVSEAITMIKATILKSTEFKENFLVSYAPIWGNANQISQIIMNLCVNAMDAMEDEGGVLEVDLYKVSSEDLGFDEFLLDSIPGSKDVPALKIEDIDARHCRLFLGGLARGQDYVVIRVKDTGSGINRVVMEHMFEPFFTTKSVDKGTGLGLSTVHGIVVSHSGFMVINSILGEGTCFEIYFPLCDNIQNVRELTYKSDGDQEIAVVDKSDKKHILLVEDQENVRNMVVLLLERLGYKVSYAVNGLDGLDMVRENPDRFDLIITDYNMPEMTGLEMVQQIYVDLPDIPFILLSGYSQDSVREIIDGHDAIKAVIRKPVSKDVLATKIKAILG